MYEVYIKTWYHAEPNNVTQEEIMYKSITIMAAVRYLQAHAEYWDEAYPVYEMGIRLKNH